MTSKARQTLEKIHGGPLTLGKLLWAIRTGDELTQKEFGNILEVPRSYVSDMENGRKFVSDLEAIGFAKKLGRSPSQFARLALQEKYQRNNIKIDFHIEVA